MWIWNRNVIKPENAVCIYVAAGSLRETITAHEYGHNKLYSHKGGTVSPESLFADLDLTS